jgi:phage gp46-like protein
MRKYKNTANPMKITKKESRKKITSEIKTKAAIFIPQNKTTMSEDTSVKSIKLKTAIQPLKAIFHLKINTTVSTTKVHSKEVASTQEEEEDKEEEEHP